MQIKMFKDDQEWTFLFIFILLNISQSSLKHISKVLNFLSHQCRFLLSLKFNFDVILAQIQAVERASVSAAGQRLTNQLQDFG